MWKILGSKSSQQNQRSYPITAQKENTIMKTPKTTISREINHSISHKPNLLISIVAVCFCFAFIPLLPILFAFVIGHWFSSQNSIPKGTK